MAALKTYRTDIDGMRAIAVLSVAAYHYGLFVPDGFVGVDVFFVISGFLIGSLIYRDACAGTFSYLAFYARRARRIVPALLAVLAATYAVMLLLATPGELADFAQTAVATVFSVSNIALWRSIDYFRPTAELNPLLMTWSLGVEEQFYLLAPVLLLLLPRLRVRSRLAALAGLIGVSLALAAWGVKHEAQAAFFLLPTRAWELAAGVLLGVLDIHRSPGRGEGQAAGLRTELQALCGLALIVAPALLYDTQTPFPGVAAVPPVVGTVLLLGASASVINRRFLSLPVMRFFGLISYSLYLWHWPLISVTRLVLVHEPSLVLRACLLLVSIALAWASYRWIEQPFRRTGLPASRSLRRYAAAMGVFALALGSAIALHGYPQRWSRSFVAATAASAEGKDPCLALTGTASPRLSPRCYPQGQHDALVALVGDSHAAALAPGVRALAARDGLALAQLTKASCPFLLGVSRKVSRHPDLLRDCPAFDRKVMQVLLRDERIRIVIIAAFWQVESSDPAAFVATDGLAASQEALLDRGLVAAVSMLERHGKRVVLVRDVPYISFLPQKRLAACASRLRGWLNGRVDHTGCDFAAQAEVQAQASADDILASVVHDTGASLVDPYAALCGDQGCRIAQGGHALYRDQQHLSPEGADLASAAFADVLASADTGAGGSAANETTSADSE